MAMFESDSKTIWEEEIRDLAILVRDTCKTDPNLTKTLETLIKYVDSDTAYGINFAERIEPLSKILNSQTYYANVHRNTPEAELTKLRELTPLVTMLHKIARHELNSIKPALEEKASFERLPNSPFTADNYKPVNMKDRNNI